MLLRASSHGCMSGERRSISQCPPLVAFAILTAQGTPTQPQDHDDDKLERLLDRLPAAADLGVGFVLQGSSS